MPSKKDLVLNKKRNKTPIIIVGAVIVLLVIINLVPYLLPDNESGIPFAAQLDSVSYAGKVIAQTSVSATTQNGLISVPLQDLKDHQFISFRYQKEGGAYLPLTAYIAPSGKVIAAVSICEPCRSESFHIDGNVLVCDACYTQWELETLKGISGGCQDFPPDALAASVIDDSLTISTEIAANWRPRV